MPASGAACQALSLDGDADIDADDLKIFGRCFTGASVSIPPGRLLISEFMASNTATILDPDDPGLNEYPDWIEIYNDDSGAVQLGGMYLSNDAAVPSKWQIPAGIEIGGGQRLLFWADNEINEGLRHTNFKLDKAGQAIVLTAADGITTIDEVTFGAQTTDVSMGRLPDVGGGWRSFAAPETPPTPGEANVAAFRVPRVVINEIMYKAYTADLQPEPTNLEFVELYNAGSFTANLTGWRFNEGVVFAFPDGTVLASGEYLVIAADVAAFQAAHPGVTHVVGGWEKHLGNDGETIEIVDANGRVIDRVAYSDQGDWAVRQRGPLDHGHYGWEWYTAHNGGGPSMELMNPALPNEYGHNWVASVAAGGTPGAANSAVSTDIAPIIGNVTQSPVMPKSTETVQLTAEIIDELKTGLTVKAYYRRDGTTAFTAVDLHDDGASGDGLAGDGVFGGTLPAQPNGTVVEYYFEAIDAGGHTRHQPAFTLPTNTPLTNRLYRVDDSFDPTWYDGQQPLYYIILTAAEKAELADIGDASTDGISEQDSNAQMNGTFVSVDSEGVKSRFNVGVRNRGKGSRSDPPMNYRVNFVHEHTWNGVAGIDINSKYPWLQVLGGAIFDAAGIQTANTWGLQIRVNGQNLAETGRRMYSAYTFLEPFNSDFTHNHFPADGDGNVYSCRGWISQGGKTWFGELDYRGTDPALYRINYAKDSNTAEEDWSDLIHLTDVLSNTPDATYAEQVAGVVNVDQWMRWFAVMTLIGDAETNLGNGVGDDYSMYCGKKDPRFVLLPHDLDTILGMGYGTPAKTSDSIWLAAKLANVKRFLQNPAFCRLYYRQLRDLAQTVFSAGQIDPMIDNLLGSWVPASDRTALKTFAAARNTYVLAQIPAALTIQSDLPIVNGHHYSTQSMAALYGQGNAYDTGSVVVNGLPAQWDCVAGTWKIGVPGILVAKGSKWHFLDNTPDPAPAGWQTVASDDPWPEQNARLGYGGDGETQPPLKYGPDANNKYMTYYFRRTFAVGDTAQITGLTLRLLRDDGAVVYINGTKVALPQSVDNMPDVFDNTTPASSGVDSTGEQTFFEATGLSKSLLVPNATNVIAIEVHQISKTSSDLSFDLELVAEGGVVMDGVPLSLGLNTILVQEFDGPDGTGNEVERGTIDIEYGN